MLAYVLGIGEGCVGLVRLQRTWWEVPSTGFPGQNKYENESFGGKSSFVSLEPRETPFAQLVPLDYVT